MESFKKTRLDEDASRYDLECKSLEAYEKLMNTIESSYFIPNDEKRRIINTVTHTYLLEHLPDLERAMGEVHVKSPFREVLSDILSRLFTAKSVPGFEEHPLGTTYKRNSVHTPLRVILKRDYTVKLYNTRKWNDYLIPDRATLAKDLCDIPCEPDKGPHIVQLKLENRQYLLAVICQIESETPYLELKKGRFVYPLSSVPVAHAE
jgi:hypothetical protein